MSPTPSAVAAARARAQHTAAQAAAIVHSGRGQTWLDWEAGRRAMPAASWELYLLRTGQHPELVLQPRAA